MCKYCEKIYNDDEFANQWTYIGKKDKKIILKTAGGDSYYSADIEINYCPICGRELKGE